MTDANIVIGIRGETSGARVIKRELDSLKESANSATESTKKLDQTFERTEGSAKRLTTALKGLLAGLGIREIIRAADQFKLLEARIANSTRTAEEFAFSMAALRDISRQTGTELEAAVEVFQRLSFVREEIKASAEEMVAFTGNVQKLGVVSGASVQSLNAGLRQLGQALSSDIVRAEEFNSIMENIPAVGRAIADELGITTGEMRNLVIQGELLSKDVFAAILNQTKDINQEFDKFPETIGRAWQGLLLDMQSAVNEMDNLTGGTEIFIKGIQLAGGALNALVQLIKGFGNTIKAFFTVIVASIIDAFNTVTLSIKRLINEVIEGINKIKPGASIELLDTSGPGYSRSDLAGAALETALGEVANAKAGFRGYFDAVSEIFDGKQQQRNANIETQTRRISKNYEEIVEKIGEADKQTKKASDTTENYAGQFDNLVNRIDRDLTRAFGDAFSSGESGFGNMLRRMGDSFTKFLEQISFQAARPIMFNIAGGFAGGSLLNGIIGGPASAAVVSGPSATGGGVGGLGSILGGLSSINSLLNSTGPITLGGLFPGGIGQSLGFQQALAPGVYGPVAPGSIFGSTTLGGALGGIGIGSLAAGLLGLGNENMAINLAASTAGGLGGAALLGGVVGGPVGAAIGSFLGSAIGGLFGGQPSNKLQRGAIDLSTLERDTRFSQTGKKFSQKNADARDAILDQIAALTSLLSSGGATFDGSVSFSVGNRTGFSLGDPKLGTGITQSFARTEQGAAQFFEALYAEVISKAQGLSQNVQQAISRTGTGDFEALSEGIQLAQLIDSFTAKSDTPTNALTVALEALDEQFANLAERAEALGLPIDQLTDAYERQRQSLIEQTLKPLQDWLDAQALSASSSLSPVDRLGLARSEFDKNLAAIRNGDLSGLGSLTTQASTLLGIGRDVFASSEGYANLEAYVRGSVAGVAGDLGAPGGLNDSVVRTITLSNAEQTSILQQLLVETQALRAENERLRKNMERVGNALVVQS